MIKIHEFFTKAGKLFSKPENNDRCHSLHCKISALTNDRLEQIINISGMSKSRIIEVAVSFIEVEGLEVKEPEIEEENQEKEGNIQDEY